MKPALLSGQPPPKLKQAAVTQPLMVWSERVKAATIQLPALTINAICDGAVGAGVGMSVSAVGIDDGEVVGSAVGMIVGKLVGAVGIDDGEMVGSAVGMAVGKLGEVVVGAGGV